MAHYLATNTYPGATPLEYGFIGSLSISMALLVSPIATVTTRKYGTRTTLTIGILFETAALLGASFTYEIWQLFLSQGLCFGWGMGFLFVGSVGVVPQWFKRRRSFANSIGTAGSGIGALVYSLATNAMIQNISLGWAFRVLAILAFSVNGIAAFLIRDRNKQIGSVQKPFDIQLFKKPAFLLFLGWGWFSMLGYVILLFSVANYARSIGLTAEQASVVSALLNLGQGIGRPLVGYFSDAGGRINMAMLCTFFSGLFCLVIWIFATSYGVLIFFVLITGAVAGTFWTTAATVCAEVIGLKKLPSALSVTWLVLVLPCTFAEPIGLELRTGSGDQYLHAQLFAGFMYVGGAMCLWFLRAWKIKELGEITELESEKQREMEIRNDDAVPRGQRPTVSRTASRAASVKSKVQDVRGLWAWQKV